MAITLALVDDDLAMHERVREAVAADAGLELVQALADAGSALAWLRHAGADVMLVDLGLPDASGLEVIAAAARRYPAADILVLSVFDDADRVLRSIQAGARGYLLKDSSAAEIVAAVRQVRAGGAPMSPSIARLVLTRLRADGGDPTAAAPPGAGAAVTLTPAEHKVLRYAARGFKTAEIAQLCGVSVHTVHSQVKSVYAKLSVNSRSEAVFEASRLGLLGDLFPGAGGA